MAELFVNKMRLFAVRMTILLICLVSTARAADWLQFGYDPAHSGSNVSEKGYSTATGNHRIYSVDLSNSLSPAYARFESPPLFVSNVETGAGAKDLLFAMSTSGVLVAIDAEDGSVLWSKQPLGGGHDTRATPAVDPSKGYVFAHGNDGRVHKYHVADGTEVTGNGWPEVSTLKPNVEKGASGLTVASTPVGTMLYSVTSGYYGDMGDYQGHLTAINLESGEQNVFNSLCSSMPFHFVENGTAADDCIVQSSGGRMSGIWGAAGAVFDSGTNRVYVATGNGLFDADTPGGREWGDSVLALNPDGTGSAMGYPADSYTPTTYADLYGGDVDLGASSPTILPVPAASKYKHLALQSGKDHCLRLLNLENLSGQGGPGAVGGELNADACASQTLGGQSSVWIDPEDGSTWVFVSGGWITAYQVAFDNAGLPQLVRKWQLPSQGTFGTISNSVAVVANDELYYTTYDSVIYAVKVRTGEVIWTDSSLMEYTFWNKPPIVVNGRIYFTFSSKVAAFELDGVFRSGFQKH